MQLISPMHTLEREPVFYNSDPSWNLEENGATGEECAVLCSQVNYRVCKGERVELNAMTSDQLIVWLERKLLMHGVKKLIPNSEALAAAYRRAVFLQRLEEEIKSLQDEVAEDPVDVPKGLERKIRKALKDAPELPWDEVVWGLASGE